jgi:glycosyltransferase involved in cell wall biosynthesis
MAHGLPVVVADVAENVEAMGESGLAVPYGDEEALVAALRWLVENEDELASLGERARRRVATRFSAEDMISGTRDVYKKCSTVLGPRRLRPSSAPQATRQ